MITIVPTPIGNLKDITLRSIETLQSVDFIICEDTRRTSLLLQHLQIKKPLVILNDFNEARAVDSLVERLKTGQTAALVSDAGTPLVSDPGYKLIRKCLEEEIEVDSLPGPSSVTTALTLSGLPPDKFMFLGYFPEKEGHRKLLLKKLLGFHLQLEVTHIFFASPYKILKDLEDVMEVFGDIEVILAHELTKIHQSVQTKQVSEWLKLLKNPKGEYIVLLRI